MGLGSVVVDGGTVRGFGWVRPADLDGREGGVLLEDLYVAPPGAGYGPHLLLALTQQARFEGRYMWMSVEETNAAAREFFSNAGWLLTGSRSDIYESGRTFSVYRKDFPASYQLIAADGSTYSSPTPGRLGGYAGSGRHNQLYGHLDCVSARSQIRRGGYVGRRVFFASEEDAATCSTGSPGGVVVGVSEWNVRTNFGGDRVGAGWAQVPDDVFSGSSIRYRQRRLSSVSTADAACAGMPVWRCAGTEDRFDGGPVACDSGYPPADHYVVAA
ncbi:MAG: GNAT family N-acetyltransferase [Maioricimonas sp. JB049]